MLEYDIKHNIAFNQYINLEYDKEYNKEYDIKYFLKLDFCRYLIIIKHDIEEDYRKPHMTILTQYS